LCEKYAARSELAEEDPAEYDNGPEVERPIDWGSEEEWIDQDDREIPENTAVRAGTGRSRFRIASHAGPV
jgi:hypothetical protein